jgi:hypothetical protein
VQRLDLLAVLAQLVIDLLQVLVDLVRVVAPHHSREVAAEGFLEEVAELSVNVGLHVPNPG